MGKTSQELDHSNEPAPANDVRESPLPAVKDAVTDEEGSRHGTTHDAERLASIQSIQEFRVLEPHLQGRGRDFRRMIEQPIEPEAFNGTGIVNNDPRRQRLSLDVGNGCGLSRSDRGRTNHDRRSGCVNYLSAWHDSSRKFSGLPRCNASGLTSAYG